MGKIDSAIHEIHHIDYSASKDMWLNNIHPLSKLIVTVIYIAVTVSFDKYDLSGLAAMILYPFVIILLADISFKRCLKRMKTLLTLVYLVGIVNPFIDKTVLFTIGSIGITGGIISMLTLMLKGSLAVTASYMLIISTRIEDICYAFRCLHIPKMFVTVILLIYRYIIVLLKETERVIQAYTLRAPNERGVHFRAWGTLAGLLLLRSMDRAELVYESMMLRGYDGDFLKDRDIKQDLKSIIYAVALCGVFFFFRFIPILKIVGAIFV